MKVLFSAAFLLLSSAPVVAHASGRCLTADAGIDQIRLMVAAIASSSDSGAVRFRAENGLPRVDSSAVAFVSDSTICAQASAALLLPLEGSKGFLP